MFNSLDLCVSRKLNVCFNNLFNIKMGCIIIIYMVVVISDLSCEREVVIVLGLLIYSII